MSNLENLVSKIVEDSNNKAQEIIHEANEQANKILNEKINDANTKKEQILNTAKIEAEREKEQIIAGNRLQIRDKKLNAKQEIIEKALKEAAVNLKQLSADDYQKFLEEQLLSLNLKGDEVLILPAQYKDIDISAINQKLEERQQKGNLSVDKEGGRDIDSGFIILREGVENNNTFESLLEYYRTELETVIVSNLF